MFYRFTFYTIDIKQINVRIKTKFYAANNLYSTQVDQTWIGSFFYP